MWWVTRPWRELILSESLLDISDVELGASLNTFFLSPFSDLEFHSFTFTNEEFTLNPMFSFAFSFELNSNSDRANHLDA